MKTYRTTILLLFAAVCPAAAQTDTTAVLATFARVRILVPQWTALSEELGTRWHTGMVVGGVAHCIRVSPDSVTLRDLDPTIPPRTRLPALGVPFDMIARIQVSSLYDGRYVQGQRARVYERGADVTEEQWIELSVDSVMRDPSSCPGGTRNEHDGSYR